MKLALKTGVLPNGAMLVTCSSHEDRCKALLLHAGEWTPSEVVLFHYDDPNPIREENHLTMETEFQRLRTRLTVLKFTEGDPVRSMRDNMHKLRQAIERAATNALVIDISVFTKRHFLMMLRWLDDSDLWSRLYVVYSEPRKYLVSKYIPLSFGLSTLQETPGFSACSDLSRPIHLVMFLGYEGDRALAVYEQIQPMRVTLAVPYPPYRPNWEGRTEEYNSDLLALVGSDAVRGVDALEPDATTETLGEILGESARDDYARIVCPLGTKPQTLGIYNYLRNSQDPPAIVYASPLRHNHSFFSRGLGQTWLLQRP